MLVNVALYWNKLSYKPNNCLKISKFFVLFLCFFLYGIRSHFDFFFRRNEKVKYQVSANILNYKAIPETPYKMYFFSFCIAHTHNVIPFHSIYMWKVCTAVIGDIVGTHNTVLSIELFWMRLLYFSEKEYSYNNLVCKSLSLR